MKRRAFIRNTSITGVAFIVARHSFGKTPEFPVVRVAEGARRFKSKTIESLIEQVNKDIGNKELGWLFHNCFPNTLDTTVEFEVRNGKPDTYVITGDIDAMWLRDSSAQIWPYLPFMKEDSHLQELIAGVIYRQTQSILLDPYANAFYKDLNKVSEWKSDLTEMKPGIHERKWEIDSLCFPIKLSYGYWKNSGDLKPFNSAWREAMRKVLQTFKEQQRVDSKGPYSFQRTTSWATDGVPLGGYGYPAKPNGMICSTFRPSDDATIFPYLVPSNWFAVFALDWLTDLAKAIGDEDLSRQAFEMGTSLAKILWDGAIVYTEKFGNIWVYETNGLGSCHLMDDANMPSHLSIPYLADNIFSNTRQSIWDNTRKYALSESNPFHFTGSAATGVGSPHTGLDMIWPMSIAVQGLTSIDETEMKWCLQTLQNTHAGTGFMHESFHKDDPSKFTRKWFAWANAMFSEFLLKMYRRKPHLLK